jgi:folate-binding protein YgfZ
MSPSTSAPTAASTLLRLAGADVLPLLHRLSTAFLEDLAAGQARATLFCDFRGRLLHRAIVAVASDRAVWLVHDLADGAALAAFLDRSVFREDVRLTGDGAGFRVRAVPDAGLTPGTLREADGMPLVVSAGPDGALVIEQGGPVPPDGEAERARIAAGRPRHGHEIAEAFTPFEVGLASEVHLAKGCWTGQEALMRMVTHGSARRRLVELGGGGPPPAVPRDLLRRGERAGVISSAVARVEGGWIGLGVVANALAESDEPLEVEGGGVTSAMRAFPRTRPAGLSAE